MLTVEEDNFHSSIRNPQYEVLHLCQMRQIFGQQRLFIIFLIPPENPLILIPSPKILSQSKDFSRKFFQVQIRKTLLSSAGLVINPEPGDKTNAN